MTTKHPHDYPFFVRQSGLKYGTNGYGAIVGFDDENKANADCDDRNKRAKEMGLKARYEVASK